MLPKEEKRRIQLTLFDDQWRAEMLDRVFDLRLMGAVVRPSSRLNEFGYPESIALFSKDGGLLMNLRRDFL